MARSSQLIIPTPTNACLTSVIHEGNATDRNTCAQISHFNCEINCLLLFYFFCCCFR